MATALKTDHRIPAGLIVLIGIQVVCLVFFLGDVVADYREEVVRGAVDVHVGVEAAATLSLLAAIAVETWLLLTLLRRKAHLEASLKLANAAVHEVIDAHFEAWKLSPSETDVATFLVKGLSIAEIAAVRGCAEGTVKAHLNAIYRKSGTGSRGELLSAILDSLLADP